MNDAVLWELAQHRALVDICEGLSEKAKTCSRTRRIVETVFGWLMDQALSGSMEEITLRAVRRRYEAIGTKKGTARDLGINVKTVRTLLDRAGELPGPTHEGFEETIGREIRAFRQQLPTWKPKRFEGWVDDDGRVSILWETS